MLPVIKIDSCNTFDIHIRRESIFKHKRMNHGDEGIHFKPPLVLWHCHINQFLWQIIQGDQLVLNYRIVSLVLNKVVYVMPIQLDPW